MNPDPVQLEGLSYAELREPEGLQRLDDAFCRELKTAAPKLRERLLEFRTSAHPPAALEHSAFFLELAPHVEGFVARLFGIEAELAASRQRSAEHDVVLDFKKAFVQRRARRYRREIQAGFEEIDAWLDEALRAHGLDPVDRERAVALYGAALLESPDERAEEIERLTQWCVLALKDLRGRRRVAGWASFRLPRLQDPGALVPLRGVSDDPAGRMQGDPAQWRRREGFQLTDPRMSLRDVHSEVRYCIYCHDHDGDFCSKGFPEKKGEPELGFKVNALETVLTGCPLEEKISEMHTLKRDGRAIASLAVAMVDNPMVPATGHRICNDCMKACIYQKQDPVDIPQIETRVLTDVLELPWGVEVYHLLTRWNPLRHRQYVARPYNGRKVLINGMGPAGFTMAHHLTMEGCAVVGIDGLKIEPLPRALVDGPVRDYQELVEPLDKRTNYGFGGVAEYGITVRWDKNFLKLIYLTLARRPNFQVFGGVRWGGTITVDDAWSLGFDHVCIACGAGLPRVIPMGNSLARGMRQANDFLMALQLTGAAKHDSLANLQVRMPAVVIGGGLTAIDTATEVQAYYISQVEKMLNRYERLATAQGEDSILAVLDEENQAILSEFLAHGREVRAERERAAQAGEEPDFIPLLRKWGGVTLVYRRGMNESPAYLRNHEEVIKALEEGIYYAQGLEPMRAELDGHGHVGALLCRRRVQHEGRWIATKEELQLPARSIFVAAGAAPNIIYEREHPGTFLLDGDHYLPHISHRRELQPVQPVQHCKEHEFGPFTSYGGRGGRVTFIGDTHPAFHGSVVKAIASAQRTYPQIMDAVNEGPGAAADWQAYTAFRACMEDLLTARVAEVRREHPSVVEILVRAPLAARNFRAGQFFRLQTFEQFSPVVEQTRLQVPLQTVSGAGVEEDKIRLFVLRGGANARLLAERVRPGDPLVLMGPAGAPSEIGTGKTVLVIAGRWGAAAMQPFGQALRSAGNRVLYMATFGRAEELYNREQLEAAADRIVWATSEGEPVPDPRPGDISVCSGNVIELIRDYARGAIVPAGDGPAISLKEVDEVLIMGSTGLLQALQGALRKELRDCFRENVHVVGTVGSPMQCMLQGVCAQCLQWQVDPQTGERTRAVFSCAMQDQPLFWIDLHNLWARQTQNRLQEQLGDLWLSHVLERADRE